MSDERNDPDLEFWRELKQDVQATFPGRHFFVLVVDTGSMTRQWYASAGGPWATELRNAADEYERGFSDDCELDERRKAHDEN